MSAARGMAPLGASGCFFSGTVQEAVLLLESV
jgi:hypothetical protein